MARQYGDPTAEGEASIRWLLKSLAVAFVDGLRRNKIASVLAFVTLSVLVVLALDSRFDGLEDYQQGIMPRLLRLENGFHRSLRYAESTSGEWRAYYFENAHRDVKVIIRAATLSRPGAHFARKKHAEFVRYYRSLDREFNAISTQLSANPNLDYVQQLRTKMDELKTIRDRWADWAKPAQSANLKSVASGG